MGRLYAPTRTAAGWSHAQVLYPDAVLRITHSHPLHEETGLVVLAMRLPGFSSFIYSLAISTLVFLAHKLEVFRIFFFTPSLHFLPIPPFISSSTHSWLCATSRWGSRGSPSQRRRVCASCCQRCLRAPGGPGLTPAR